MQPNMAAAAFPLPSWLAGEGGMAAADWLPQPEQIFQLSSRDFAVSPRCCCGRLVRQHVGFTASLASKYSDVKLAENAGLPPPAAEEWSVEKHTEASPTDAYGVINFQGGSHSYRAKVGGPVPPRWGSGSRAACSGWSLWAWP